MANYVVLTRRNGTPLTINLDLLGAYDDSFLYAGQVIPIEPEMATVLTSIIRQIPGTRLRYAPKYSPTEGP